MTLSAALLTAFAALTVVAGLRRAYRARAYTKAKTTMRTVSAMSGARHQPGGRGVSSSLWNIPATLVILAVGGEAFGQATLTNLSRTVDLTGSGNPGNLDPILYPLEGAALTTLTRSTLGGQPGIAVTAGAPACIWLCTAVPLAAFNTDAEAPSTSVSVEWEQERAASGRNGGVMLYHYSGDHFGSDGAGYFFDIFGSSGFLFARASDATPNDGFGAAVTSAALPDTSIGYHRFKATVTNEGGNTKTCKLEQWVTGAWSTVFNATGVTNRGSMFGVAFISNATNNTLNLRGPSGANGPIVTFKGFPTVIAGIGQSEFSGAAASEDATTDDDIVTIGWTGAFKSPGTAPVWGAAGTATNWSGYSTGYGGNVGSMVTALLAGVKERREDGAIVAHAASLQSGSTISQHTPPAAGTRYLATSRGGVHALLTTILAGDGRTEGQTVFFPVWIGTSDAIGGTSQASWESSFGSIQTRLNALFPTSGIYLAKIGDRTFWTGCTQAESQAIRDAQEAIIGREEASLWFDDAVVVGAVGTGTGWPDDANANADHPGPADYDILAPLAVNGLVPADDGGAPAGPDPAQAFLILLSRLDSQPADRSRRVTLSALKGLAP